MNKQKALLRVIYAYVSFAFLAVVVDALGFLHPIPDVVAGIMLLTVCFYIGKYGKLTQKSRK